MRTIIWVVSLCAVAITIGTLVLFFRQPAKDLTMPPPCHCSPGEAPLTRLYHCRCGELHCVLWADQRAAGQTRPRVRARPHGWQSPDAMSDRVPPALRYAVEGSSFVPPAADGIPAANAALRSLPETVQLYCK